MDSNATKGMPMKLFVSGPRETARCMTLNYASFFYIQVIYLDAYCKSDDLMLLVVFSPRCMLCFPYECLLVLRLLICGAVELKGNVSMYNG